MDDKIKKGIIKLNQRLANLGEKIKDSLAKKGPTKLKWGQRWAELLDGLNKQDNPEAYDYVISKIRSNQKFYELNAFEQNSMIVKLGNESTTLKYWTENNLPKKYRDQIDIRGNIAKITDHFNKAMHQRKVIKGDAKELVSKINLGKKESWWNYITSFGAENTIQGTGDAKNIKPVDKDLVNRLNKMFKNYSSHIKTELYKDEKYLFRLERNLKYSAKVIEKYEKDTGKVVELLDKLQLRRHPDPKIKEKIVALKRMKDNMEAKLSIAKNENESLKRLNTEIRNHAKTLKAAEKVVVKVVEKPTPVEDKKEGLSDVRMYQYILMGGVFFILLSMIFGSPAEFLAKILSSIRTGITIIQKKLFTDGPIQALMDAIITPLSDIFSYIEENVYFFLLFMVGISCIIVGGYGLIMNFIEKKKQS